MAEEVTTDQVRKHPEYLAMLENLTAVQTRCTELLDTYRALKKSPEVNPWDLQTFCNLELGFCPTHTEAEEIIGFLVKGRKQQ